MFRRILVPVDFTPKSSRALRAAARIASASGGEVTLLHVIEKIEGEDLPEIAAFHRKLSENARRRMEEFQAELKDRKIAARAEIVLGDRVREILAAARERRSDLIVMSSHRLATRRPSESWGTISYKVGLLAACPVLLVK